MMLNLNEERRSTHSMNLIRYDESTIVRTLLHETGLYWMHGMGCIGRFGGSGMRGTV